MKSIENEGIFGTGNLSSSGSLNDEYPEPYGLRCSGGLSTYQDWDMHAEVSGFGRLFWILIAS